MVAACGETEQTVGRQDTHTHIEQGGCVEVSATPQWGPSSGALPTGQDSGSRSASFALVIVESLCYRRQGTPLARLRSAVCSVQGSVCVHICLACRNNACCVKPHQPWRRPQHGGSMPVLVLVPPGAALGAAHCSTLLVPFCPCLETDHPMQTGGPASIRFTRRAYSAPGSCCGVCSLFAWLCC